MEYCLSRLITTAASPRSSRFLQSSLDQEAPSMTKVNGRCYHRCGSCMLCGSSFLIVADYSSIVWRSVHDLEHRPRPCLFTLRTLRPAMEESSLLPARHSFSRNAKDLHEKLERRADQHTCAGAPRFIISPIVLSMCFICFEPNRSYYVRSYARCIRRFMDNWPERSAPICSDPSEL